MIRFVVPGQPQGKGRARIGRVGAHARMFTPAKTVAYEALVAREAAVVMAGRPLIDGPVWCSVDLHCQIPASWSKRKQAEALAGSVHPTTKPDADNVVKAIFDGLNGVVWRDDVQVVGLTLTKRYSATPCVAFTASEVPA